MTGLLERNTNNTIAEPRRDKARDKNKSKHHDSSGIVSLNGHQQRHPGNGRTQVLQTLESEIIPRLVLSCRNSKSEFQPAQPETAPVNGAANDQVADFAKMLMAEEAEVVSRHLASLRAKGASLEWLYMELLSPAARHLGYLWEEDHCTIIDVTLGVGRLQQLLREISPEFQQYRGLPDMRRRALLLPVEGEQHTFGLSLLMDFFRHAGWDLWGWPLADNNDLLALLRNEWFGVIGLSVSAQVNLTGLSTLIRDIRSVSGNPSISVLVGGPVFIKNPQLSQEIGADGTAVDPRQAVSQAESLLRRQ